MLTDIELQILKTELENDPSGLNWDTLSLEDIVTNINKRQLIDNPEQPEQVTEYVITNSQISTISATKFLNKITMTSLLDLKNDIDGGNVFYDRLLALESSGGVVDVSEDIVNTGVAYALSKEFITANESEALIGKTLIDNPEHATQIEGVSRAKALEIGNVVEGQDITKARNL